MRFLAIIPARYASSRFPGKPLAKIGGVEMIIRVCQRVKESGIECVVATDDHRIAECVKKGGFRAVMTSPECGSGTERVEEAYRILNETADVIINIQGDEPFIRKEQIEAVKSIFDKYPETQIATLVKRYDMKGNYEGIEDPNLVKVVLAENGDALYFSRSVIPFIRKEPRDRWPECHQYLTHIGIYAYKAEALGKLVALPVSPLEKAESLEQLRWLQGGFSIKTSFSDFETIGIDTPADLEAAERYLMKISEQTEKI